MKQARPKRTRLRAASKQKLPGLSDALLQEAEEKMDYRFKDRALFVKALTHPSAVGAKDSVALSNQRLEFLGDRVVNLCVAERLIDRRRTESEGDLAPHLNRLVRKGACAEAFLHIGLDKYLILSDGEEASGGRERESTLGDACEAVIGAIYLDGGLSPARKFIERGWGPQFRQNVADAKDPKTRLQEWAQAQGYPLPIYKVLDRSGPDHEPVYKMEVNVGDCGKARASGSSKREAERKAAETLLKDLVDSK